MELEFTENDLMIMERLARINARIREDNKAVKLINNDITVVYAPIYHKYVIVANRMYQAGEPIFTEKCTLRKLFLYQGSMHCTRLYKKAFGTYGPKNKRLHGRITQYIIYNDAHINNCEFKYKQVFATKAINPGDPIGYYNKEYYRFYKTCPIITCLKEI